VDKRFLSAFSEFKTNSHLVSRDLNLASRIEQPTNRKDAFHISL